MAASRFEASPDVAEVLAAIEKAGLSWLRDEILLSIRAGKKTTKEVREGKRSIEATQVEPYSHAEQDEIVARAILTYVRGATELGASVAPTTFKGAGLSEIAFEDEDGEMFSVSSIRLEGPARKMEEELLAELEEQR